MNVGFVRGSTDPVAHSGKLCQVKATLRCKGRIGKQAEIGGGEIVDQPLPALQMVLHAHQRSVSPLRSEEHTSELQSLMRISYAVFCLKKKKLDSQQL